MQIRVATDKDAQSISDLIRKSTLQNPNNYSVDQQRVWIAYNSPSRVKQFMNDRTIICAVKNNLLLGTVSLKENEVLGFYVDYDLRNQGVGSALLTYVEHIAKRNGLEWLYLTSTPSATEFYKIKGFKPGKNIVVKIKGIDFPEIEMKKVL